ncbi:MAG: hypothetical protein A2146_07175 [Actinobacteria bacterium RBG_16_67_10]|nr:MAG: hypothetical protein A2146_07175 [Actinobacteria bacterium RBG_16_67_10]
MLFLTYWELNENMADPERQQVAQKLTSKGLFPPNGVKVIRWDVTPDNWGVLIFEAEDSAGAYRALDLWRAAGAGFFKTTKTAPALPVLEAIPIGAEIGQALASA